MSTKRWISILMLVVAWGSLAGCASLTGNAGSTSLKASGTISTDTIEVAPEISGKIAEIKVEKGDTVKAGDALFTLDAQILQAQVDQANAAVKVAQSNLDAAQQKQAGAQTQYDLAVQTARQQDQASRTTSWQDSQADKITLPVWYFQKSEEISALQAQVQVAQKNLDTELANLDAELKDASNADFVSTEKQLNQAQQAYTIAQQTLDEAKAAKDTTSLQDAAQKQLDAAQADLDSAQKAYDQMLTSDAANRVMEARARVAVAQEQLDNTQSALDKLMTGSDSLQITAAQSSLDQAKSGVSQAQAALDQAQAALQVANVQLEKTGVAAPTAGIVLSRPMNPGEVAAAGATVVEIGNLDQVKLTVYIPESDYGRIQLEQKATITVDSFPGKTFTGTVSYISDQAEFTPRNVQTVDSRSTTVYKVEISLPNPNHDLKPGMPADAVLEVQ